MRRKFNPRETFEIEFEMTITDEHENYRDEYVEWLEAILPNNMIYLNKAQQESLLNPDAELVQRRRDYLKRVNHSVETNKLADGSVEVDFYEVYFIETVNGMTKIKTSEEIISKKFKDQNEIVSFVENHYKANGSEISEGYKIVWEDNDE